MKRGGWEHAPSNPILLSILCQSNLTRTSCHRQCPPRNWFGCHYIRTRVQTEDLLGTTCFLRVFSGFRITSFGLRFFSESVRFGARRDPIEAEILADKVVALVE